MQKILYCLVFISLFLNINTSSSEEYNTLKMDMVDVSFISTLTKINKNNFYIGLEFNLNLIGKYTGGNLVILVCRQH